ncbi:MAG: phage tail protein [Campylobacterales bacterium]|nr:phage tail protein [Campylobacterales bacterium]
MFCVLGDIEFKLITYFESLDSQKAYTFAKHSVIEGKPSLQFIGDELDGVNIKLNFHIDFCNPKEEYDKLEAAASKHEPLPFVFGNGIYKGNYVIESLSKGLIMTHGDGTEIGIDATMKLTEYVENKAIIFKKEQKKKKPKKVKAKKKKAKAPTPPTSAQVKAKNNVPTQKITRQQ